jgi:hypothetical protein
VGGAATAGGCWDRVRTEEESMKLSDLGMTIDLMIADGHGDKKVEILVGDEMWGLCDLFDVGEEHVVMHVEATS